MALTLVPMDLDEQTVPCFCVYTCQLQEAHPRWQKCHFGIPSSFTPDHTCRWECQEHLWVTRLEEVTGTIDAKWTSWLAEGAWRPSMWVLWKYIKLVHCAQIATVPGIQLLCGKNSGTRKRQVGLHLWPKGEVSYWGKRDWQTFICLAESDPHCIGDMNLCMLNRTTL